MFGLGNRHLAAASPVHVVVSDSITCTIDWLELILLRYILASSNLLGSSGNLCSGVAYVPLAWVYATPGALTTRLGVWMLSCGGSVGFEVSLGVGMSIGHFIWL